LKGFILFIFLFFIIGCNNNEEKKIIIKGDGLGEIIFNDFLSTVWQGEFVEFKGGGAQSALFSLIDKTVDIVFSFKELSNEDYLLLNSKKIYVKVIPIIKVPLVFIVNIKNPTEQLSLIDLKNIFSGYYKYWWQLGDKKTRALIRNNPVFGSIEYCSLDKRNGEYYSVRSELGIADFYLDVKFFPHSKAIQDYVKNSENAIGYVPIPFFSSDYNTSIKIVNQDIEVKGYLIVKESLYQTNFFYNFFQALKSYLIEKKFYYLNKGIKLIIEDYNF